MEDAPLYLGPIWVQKKWKIASNIYILFHQNQNKLIRFSQIGAKLQYLISSDLTFSKYDLWNQQRRQDLNSERKLLLVALFILSFVIIISDSRMFLGIHLSFYFNNFLSFFSSLSFNSMSRLILTWIGLKFNIGIHLWNFSILIERGFT